MGLINTLNSWIKNKVVGWLEGEFNTPYVERANSLVSRRSYRLGMQKRFLKNTREGFDDNVIANFLALALDRGISLLFGKEVEFEWEEEVPDEVIDWIEAIWEANNKPITLHKMAMYGGEDGTVFVKLVPDAKKEWRIIPQDPIFKDVLTDPDDDDRVIRYITQYKTADLDGNEVARRETILIGNWEQPDTPLTHWIIRNEISSKATGGRWQLVSEEVWPFHLPPMLHWQNLPMAGAVWGMPDISDDVIELQDKSNFAISNINRILRLFAHPQRWSRYFSGDLDVGPDSMPNKDHEKAEIYQLQPVGDVPGAVGHAQNLRQIMFDVTRNMDISSMKDNVGALTNFGLRILFYDALSKLDTKRALYAWGLREINRRLLLFSGSEPYDCEVIWQDPLPKDETAERQNYQMDLNMGIVSKKTVSERLGYDWDDEQEKMAEEQTAGDNIGAALLRAFEGGGQPARGGLANVPIQRQPIEATEAG